MRAHAGGLTTAPRRPAPAAPERERSHTGERVRVAREELARAREHLEQAKRRFQRARGKGRDG
ncbi:MAG TPA: hypothetical protein VIF09_01250 [Polyangiaceae bacterium]